MVRSCMECGLPLPERTGRKGGQVAKFCSAACRQRFNNRRATRGAELYDFYLSSRYQRATHGGNIAIMNQMANIWREDDKKNRDGRPSWMTPDLSADPHAFSLK